MADVSPSAANDALRRPSAFTADPAGLRRNLASAGAEAQKSLSTVVTGPGNTAADRVAAAVILAAHFDDTSGSAAVGTEDTTDPEVLSLHWSEDLRAEARSVLGQPVIMSLLTWASTANPADAPVPAARTAAELGIDDDGAIFQKVSQRAVQLAQQRGTSRARKEELRQFTEALGRADQRARQSRSAAPGTAGAPAAQATDAGPDVGPDSPPDAPDAPAGTGPSAESPSEDRPGPGDGTGSGPAEAEQPSSSGQNHPEHTSDAQPSQWSAHDDNALNDLLGQGKPVEDQAGLRDDPDYGRPVGFGDSPAEGPAEDHPPASEVGGDRSDGDPGPKDEPRYGDRFEDRQWSGDTDEGQDPPGPGPRRAYDPRALFDGPMSPAQKADEKNVLRNWAITAAVLVGILILVGLLI